MKTKRIIKGFVSLVTAAGIVAAQAGAVNAAEVSAADEPYYDWTETASLDFETAEITGNGYTGTVEGNNMSFQIVAMSSNSQISTTTKLGGSRAYYVPTAGAGNGFLLNGVFPKFTVSDYGRVYKLSFDILAESASGGSAPCYIQVGTVTSTNQGQAGFRNICNSRFFRIDNLNEPTRIDYYLPIERNTAFTNSAEGSICSIRIRLSGTDGNGNEISYPTRLYMDDFSLKLGVKSGKKYPLSAIGESGLFGNSGKYAAAWSFDGDSDGETAVYIAEYDKGGILQRVSRQSIEKCSADTVAVMKLDAVSRGNTLRVYTVKDGTLTPLSDAAEKEITEKPAPIRRGVPISELEPNSDIGLHFEEYTVKDKIPDGITGTEVISRSDSVSSGFFSRNKRNGAWANQSIVSCDDGTTALRVDVTNVGSPQSNSNLQLLKKPVTAADAANTYKNGDNCLIKVVFRTVSAENEAGTGRICVIIHDTKNYVSRVRQELKAGSEWVTAYIPFKADRSASENQLAIDVTYGLQTLEFAEVSITNYEDKLSVSDMPASDDNLAAIKECTDKDAEWRREALDRIEEVRKGDLNIRVVDKNGTPIPRAAVSLDMTEHDFEWGTAVNSYAVNGTGTGVETYLDNIGRYFNSAVLESIMQWNAFDKNSSTAHALIDAVRGRGIRHIRGHSLVWDSSGGFSDAATAAANAGNRAEYDKEVRKHIAEECLDFYGDADEWDVMNESLYQKATRSKFDDSVMTDWFGWAREYSHPDTKLFYNEIRPDDGIFDLLDTMTENGADFDGIGLQSHRTFGTVEPFYERLKRLSERYGKRLKITEFDLDEDDEILQGENTRDFMIACFSCEAVDGFYMWGFADNVHWLGNAPLLDKNGELKYSGKQFTDLVYNKWWTREKSKTDFDGSCKMRGFYGDYDLTVKALGCERVIRTGIHKGGDNTVTAVLPIEYDPENVLNYYTEVKSIDFSPIGSESHGWTIGGGANSGFSEVTLDESGNTVTKRVAYSATKNSWGGKLGNSTVLNFVAAADGAAAYNVVGQLGDVLKSENIGKNAVIQLRLQPYSAAAAGKTVDIRLGLSSYGSMWKEIIDQYWLGSAEKTVEVQSGLSVGGFSEIAYSFDVTEELVKKAQGIELAVYNGGSGADVTVAADSIKIYLEK